MKIKNMSDQCEGIKYSNEDLKKEINRIKGKTQDNKYNGSLWNKFGIEKPNFIKEQNEMYYTKQAIGNLRRELRKKRQECIKKKKIIK